MLICNIICFVDTKRRTQKLVKTWWKKQYHENMMVKQLENNMLITESHLHFKILKHLEIKPGTQREKYFHSAMQLQQIVAFTDFELELRFSRKCCSFL